MIGIFIERLKDIASQCARRPTQALGATTAAFTAIGLRSKSKVPPIDAGIPANMCDRSWIIRKSQSEPLNAAHCTGLRQARSAVDHMDKAKITLMRK